jgi:hypothetical protein
VFSPALGRTAYRGKRTVDSTVKVTPGRSALGQAYRSLAGGTSNVELSIEPENERIESIPGSTRKRGCSGASVPR